MKNKYNRVMFVTNSLSGGGAERATNILVNALSDLENQISLVAINDGPRDLIEPSCQVFELKREWQGGLLSVFNAYFKLQGVIWKWKPDYLVLNCDIPEFLGSMSIGKHKLIAVEHATYPWINRLRLGKLIRKILFARNTKWVAVSRHLKIWGSDSLPQISICNAIVMPATERARPSGRIKRLNYVGRLSEEKQPIWALEIARRTGLPIRIYGEGLLKSQLQDFGIMNNLDAQFEGFVSNPWDFFDESDLLIIPSRFEGDGLVLVEALGNRIPFIATDIPDLRRFSLENENYALNVEQFSSSIISNINSIQNFLPKENNIYEILKDREPAVVGQRWNMFLNSLPPSRF
jgi:glycosyltransferase involved in cell wall biosynthesis